MLWCLLTLSRCGGESTLFGGWLQEAEQKAQTEVERYEQQRQALYEALKQHNENLQADFPALAKQGAVEVTGTALTSGTQSLTL